MSEAHTTRAWWNGQRSEKWERLDEATRAVIRSYDDGGLIGGLSLHASAPNPNGINASISPDEWYASLPYEEGRVDVETIASSLSDELGESVKIVPRSDEWEPGFWLVVENWSDSDV